jgi:hypothetical protein
MTLVTHDPQKWPTYHESQQNNPIRWKLLYREGDIFIAQAGWWKCKDFFNDVVAFGYQKVPFSCYQFTNKVKKNDEGYYVLVKYIQKPDTFLWNINLLNKKLEADLGCQLKVFAGDTADEYIILMPNEVWRSTYIISLLTWCLRAANYSTAFDTWEDWFGPQSVRGREGAMSHETKLYAKKHGFKVDEKFSKYWYYCGADYNSEKMPLATGTIIHNCGAQAWVSYMGTTP